MQNAIEQLEEQVARVAALRRESVAMITRIREEEAAFRAENAALYDAQETMDTAIEQAEHALKILTVSHYVLTGEAKPVLGVEVKVFATFEYPADDAFAWAMVKGLAITPASLDRRAFEKVMGVLPDKPAFVHVIRTPRAQIASDLEKVLVRRDTTAAV